MKVISLKVLIFVGTLLQVQGTRGTDFSLHDTAIKITSCPSSKQGWIERSKAKNCTSAFPSNISFVYHCVINEWGNETVEVCAVQRLILFGKCAEYNFGAKRIQSSGMKMCSMFQRPCPTVYNSTEAYLYPKCYPQLQNTSSINRSQNVSKSEELSSHNSPEKDVLALSLSVCIIIIIAVVITTAICVLKRLRLRHAPRDELSECGGRFLDSETDTKNNEA